MRSNAPALRLPQQLRRDGVVGIAGVEPHVGQIQLYLNSPEPFARTVGRTVADEVLMMQREGDALRYSWYGSDRVHLKVDAARGMRQVVEKRHPLVVLLQ